MKKALSIAIVLVLLLANVCALSDSVAGPVYDLALQINDFAVQMLTQYRTLHELGHEFDSEMENRLYEYIMLYVMSQNMLAIERDNVFYKNDYSKGIEKWNVIKDWYFILDYVNKYYESYCKGEMDRKEYVESLLSLTKAFTE